ncbi:MAG: sodium/solute symporter [Planctomycetota bacterium]
MTLLDSAILGAYFVGILFVGLWFGRKERDTTDFFLGGRRQHWLLAGISIIATEVSALTYIQVPAEAFHGNWSYLQMYFGSFVGRILILFLLLPAFYGGAVTTVYEYLGQRFGPCTRTTAALMFFGSRILGSSIRLLAGSMAVAIVFDWPLWIVIVGSAAIAITYAAAGGIRAILWTDVFQTGIFLGGAIAVIAFVFFTTSGQATDSLAAAYDAGKFKIFLWDWNPNNDKVFWVLFIYTIIHNMAALGCDQDLTQRMLTCRNLREGQKSLLFNAIVGFPIVCLFLFVGIALYIYYQAQPPGALPEEIRNVKDRIFPFFMTHSLPSGLRGLLVTAVFATSMSSLASAVGALSSCAVTDFYRPIRRWLASRASGVLPSEAHFLRAAKIASLLFGVILILVAFAFAGRDKLLWEAFKWPALFFGGMLGVFLLGVTTKTRGHDRINVIAMVTSSIGLVVLKVWQEQTKTVYIAWPWWVVIGTAWTYLCSLTARTRPS